MKRNCFMALLTLSIFFCFGTDLSGMSADDNIGGAPADNNTGKFGIGFHSRFPIGGISMRYWMPERIGVQGMFMRFGVSLPSEDISGALTQLGGRFLYTIKEAANTRFYLGAGASYTGAIVKTVEEDVEYDEYTYDIVTVEKEEKETASGFGLEGVGGVEYFLSGLPDLGLAFEFGIVFMRLTPENSDDKLDLHFTTSGSVGIHYYF